MARFSLAVDVSEAPDGDDDEVLDVARSQDNFDGAHRAPSAPGDASGEVANG